MKKLFFATGTNACGKSSIAKWLIENEPAAEVIEFPELHTRATVLHSRNLIIIGKYSSKTTSGGCDTIKKKAYTQEMLRALWARPEDIFMEGYLIGTKIWIEDLLAFPEDREIWLISFNTELETCFKRIEGRSGKTRAELKNNGANVAGKHAAVAKFSGWLAENKPQIKQFQLDSENLPAPKVVAQLLTLQDGN